MIAFYASQIAYLQHLLPIAQAWPGDCAVHLVEGRGWNAREWAHQNIPAEIPVVFNHPPGRGTLTVIAAYTDLLTTRHLNPVLVEHGSGENYSGCPGLQSGSYSGGPGRDDCRAFLVPNQAVADVNDAAYGAIPSHVVGSPWMEMLRDIRRTQRAATTLPTVVISTHWDGINMCPEMASALPEYAHVLPALADDPRWNIAGHCHPRARTFAEPIFVRAGISFIADLRDVVRVADCFVCDNSSAQAETAACGIPQLVLNSAQYRRDVSHGPQSRFWSHVLGPQCDDPPMLAHMLPAALTDPMADRRAQIVDSIYPPDLAPATTRSVDALTTIAQAQ